MRVSEVSNLPSFKKLVLKRSRMIWRLSMALFLALCINLYLMSYGADIGSKTLYPDGVITVALAYSVFLIALGAACCLFYVWWANKYLDSLIEDVKQDMASKNGPSS